MPYFRTLHSLCFHALGLTNSDVMTGPRVREFGDWLGLRLSTYRDMDDGSTFGFTEGDRALFMENLSRVTMQPLRDMYNRNPDALTWRLVDRVSRGLVEYKKETAVLDFTDMLQLFVSGGWAPQLEVVFVDEAQDLSLLQWRVVDQLAKSARRVVVAGDDDQAIYRWAGAAVEHFVALEGREEVLGQSWRVPPDVQAIAASMILGVRNRRDKSWRAAEHEGCLERRGDIGTVDLSGGDTLILVRNVFLLREIEMQVRREGYIYMTRGALSVGTQTARAIKTWESLRRGGHCTAEQVRDVYQMMSSGVGFRRGYKMLPGVADDEMLSMSWLLESGGLLRTDEWYHALDRVPRDDISYIRAALARGEKLDSPSVRLSTIHGSKGGEADHVVLVPDMARRTHEEMLSQPEDERRVWYVATTRARRRLTLLKPMKKHHYVL